MPGSLNLAREVTGPNGEANATVLFDGHVVNCFIFIILYIYSVCVCLHVCTCIVCMPGAHQVQR